MGVLLVDLSLAATHSRVRLRRTYWPPLKCRLALDLIAASYVGGAFRKRLTHQLRRD